MRIWIPVNPDRVVIAFLIPGRAMWARMRTTGVPTVTPGVVSAIWVISTDLGLPRSLMRPSPRQGDDRFAALCG
jgi:hypothetical protein